MPPCFHEVTARMCLPAQRFAVTRVVTTRLGCRDV